MKKGELVSAVLFLLLGLYAIWEASKLSQSEATVGPGPGFLPTMLGAAMALLAFSMIVRSLRTMARDSGGSFLPSRLGQKNIACIVGGLAVYLLILEPLGYLVATALFAAFLLGTLERHSRRTVATLSLAIAILGYALFAVWLHVPLPRGVLEYLGIYY